MLYTVKAPPGQNTAVRKMCFPSLTMSSLAKLHTKSWKYFNPAPSFRSSGSASSCCNRLEREGPKLQLSESIELHNNLTADSKTENVWVLLLLGGVLETLRFSLLALLWAFDFRFMLFVDENRRLGRRPRTNFTLEDSKKTTQGWSTGTVKEGYAKHDPRTARAYRFGLMSERDSPVWSSVLSFVWLIDKTLRKHLLSNRAFTDVNVLWKKEEGKNQTNLLPLYHLNQHSETRLTCPQLD